MIYAMIAILIALQIADGVTTYMVLTRGGSELNPVVDWLIKKLGLETGLFVAKGVAIALIAGVGFALGLPDWWLALMCVAYLMIVFNNLFQLTAQKDSAQ